MTCPLCGGPVIKSACLDCYQDIDDMDLPICEHKPDLATIQPVNGEAIIDISCSKCGRSGSVAIDIKEIQW